MRDVWAAVRRGGALPGAIGLMVVLGVVKVSGLVLGGGPAALASAGRVVVPAAQAAGGEGSGGAHGAAAKPAAPVPVAPVAASPVAPPAPVEPAVSEAERAVLQDLRARRAALDARLQAAMDREAVLAAAERRLAERVEQLTALQTRLETLEQTRRERDEANWRGLVKTYESMRPKDAAAIFNELEQPVLMQVLDRMKEAKAAQVLAAMQPERARAATSQLAAWRSRGVAGGKG